MTRPKHSLQRYRWTLAAAGAFLVLATAACGSADAGTPGPTPITVTADTIRTAFDSSTMKNAHFTLHGTFIVKRNYFPVTGDGVLQLAPREALAMTLRVQTYSSLGVLKIQDVTIGGRLYTRLGTGRWTSKPTTDTVTTITSYVGEEIISGTAVWHVRASDNGGTYDMWIRESDAYVVQLTVTSKSGNLTMNFDSYNKSRAIAKP
jgi:hypothetical protein